MSRKWELFIAATLYATCAAIVASAILLYGVWREVRMVLFALNGGCMP